MPPARSHPVHQVGRRARPRWKSSSDMTFIGQGADHLIVGSVSLLRSTGQLVGPMLEKGGLIRLLLARELDPGLYLAHWNG